MKEKKEYSFFGDTRTEAWESAMKFAEEWGYSSITLIHETALKVDEGWMFKLTFEFI